MTSNQFGLSALVPHFSIGKYVGMFISFIVPFAFIRLCIAPISAAGAAAAATTTTVNPEIRSSI